MRYPQSYFMMCRVLKILADAIRYTHTRYFSDGAMEKKLSYSTRRERVTKRGRSWAIHINEGNKKMEDNKIHTTKCPHCQFYLCFLLVVVGICFARPLFVSRAHSLPLSLSLSLYFPTLCRMLFHVFCSMDVFVHVHIYLCGYFSMCIFLFVQLNNILERLQLTLHSGANIDQLIKYIPLWVICVRSQCKFSYIAIDIKVIFHHPVLYKLNNK